MQPANARSEAAIASSVQRDEDGDEAAALGERRKRLAEDRAERAAGVARLHGVPRGVGGRQEVADLDRAALRVGLAVDLAGEREWDADVRGALVEQDRGLR